MQRRRSALLLELFIALFILATCLLPLVNGMPLFFAKNMKQLRAIEMERIADLTYLEIKTNLAKHLQFTDLSITRKEYLLPETEICIDGKKSIVIQRTMKAWHAREFETDNKEHYALIGIQLILSDGKQEQKYDYRVIAHHKDDKHG